MLRMSAGKLESVVTAGYGESTYHDVKVLEFDPGANSFVGSVWDGNFGPDDNTITLRVPYQSVVDKFGEAAAVSAAS